MADTPLQCRMVIGDSTCGVADRGGRFIFKEGDWMMSNYRSTTLLSLPGKVYSKVLKMRLQTSNCRIRRNSAESSLAVEQWTSYLPFSPVTEGGSLIQAIWSLYNKSESCVHFSGLKIKYVFSGCWTQGCLLSCLILFLIFIDKISNHKRE